MIVVSSRTILQLSIKSELSLEEGVELIKVFNDVEYNLALKLGYEELKAALQEHFGTDQYFKLFQEG